MTSLLTPDLVGSPAHALSAAIAAREVSCVEVVRAHLDHIERLDNTYHAMISRRPRDDVMADARERDQQLSRGECMGWMHGLPHAVKDLADVGGLPTTSGFTPVGQAPDAVDDTLFVGRLRQAGAIFVGKTNTPEFGLGSHTYNAIGPTTCNAIDTSRSAGGSSGGAAVAVATGMVPVADGSDFMGSLRNPAGWNEVLSLRPTIGRVPEVCDDLFATAGAVDGPMARNVSDLALLLATMAGPDSRVPLSITDDPAELLGFENETMRTPRIGWLGDLGGYLPFDAGVLDVCERSLDAWAAIGARIERADLLPVAGFARVDDLWPTWLAFRALQVGSELRVLYDDEQTRARMKPEACWEVEGFLRLQVDDVVRSARVRSGLYRSFHELFQRFDVLALPTAQTWPFALDEKWSRVVGATTMDAYHRWMEVTTLATMAGLPVLAVPAGRGSQGWPMGLQLIGPHRSERRLLAVAAEAERHGLPRTPAEVATGS